MTNKVSEKRIALTMSAEELSDLDAYCAEGRRQTGEPFARAEVIRLAIARLIAAAPLTKTYAAHSVALVAELD